MSKKNKRRVKKTIFEDDDDILELGNLMGNEANANQIYRCPEGIVGLLKEIDETMCRIYGNQHQKDYASPFTNSGNNFKGKKFEIRSYKGETEENKNPFNFKYKNIRISGYKQLERDVTINKVITPEDGVKMFNEVMKELYNMEKKNIQIEDSFDK